MPVIKQPRHMQDPTHQSLFAGKIGDESVLRAQIAKDLQLERLKQVREKSRHLAACQTRQYRDHIDSMKDNKRAEQKFTKQTEVMERRRALEESYKHSLIETGAAHREAEMARKKTGADGRVAKRKQERRQEVIEQRFEHAVTLRREELTREEVRLQSMREHLRLRHDVGAHNREDACALAAMRRAREEQARRRHRKGADCGEDFTIATGLAVQTDVDITRRSKVVRVDTRIIRHGAVAVTRNEAVDVKIDRVHDLRKAVVKELKIKWKQEQRVEVAKEKRIEKKRKDTFATSLAALDRLDRSPQRTNRIKNITDVRRADNKTIEIADNDALLSEFENLFFNATASSTVEREIAERARHTAVARDDTSEESAAHSSPGSSPENSFDQDRPVHRHYSELGPWSSGNGSVCSDDNDKFEVGSIRKRWATSSADDFDGHRCQLFAGNELRPVLAFEMPNDGLREADDGDTDVDLSALDQSTYSLGAQQLPYADQDVDTSEQDNCAAMGDSMVSSWNRARRMQSPRNRAVGSSQSRDGHSSSMRFRAAPLADWAVSGWSVADNVFATAIPSIPLSQDTAASASDIASDCASDLDSEIRVACSAPVIKDFSSNGYAGDSQRDGTGPSFMNRSFNSAGSALDGGMDTENDQLFFESADYAYFDLPPSNIVTSPEIRPPPPPSIDADKAQQWYESVSLSEYGDDSNLLSEGISQISPSPEFDSPAAAGNIGVLVRVTETSVSDHLADHAHGTVLYADVNIPHAAFPGDRLRCESNEVSLRSSSSASSSQDSVQRLQLDINRPISNLLIEPDVTSVLNAVVPAMDSSDDSLKIDPELYQQYTRRPLIVTELDQVDLPPLMLSITPDTSRDNLSFNNDHGIDDSWREEQRQRGESRSGRGCEDISANLSVASTIAARHDCAKAEISFMKKSDMSICSDGLVGLTETKRPSKSPSQSPPLPPAFNDSDDGEAEEALFQVSPPSRTTISSIHQYTFEGMDDSISSTTDGDDSAELEVDRSPAASAFADRVGQFGVFPSPSFARTARAEYGHASEDGDSSSQSSLSWSADQSRTLSAPIPSTSVTPSPITVDVAQAPTILGSVNVNEPLCADKYLFDEAEERGLDEFMEKPVSSTVSSLIANHIEKDLSKVEKSEERIDDLFGGASSVDSNYDSLGLNDYNISLDNEPAAGKPGLVANDMDEVDAKFDALLAYAAARSPSSRSSESVSAHSASTSTPDLNESNGSIDAIRRNYERSLLSEHSHTEVVNAMSATKSTSLMPLRNEADSLSVTSDSLNQSFRSSPSLSIEMVQPVNRSKEQQKNHVGYTIATSYMRHVSAAPLSSNGHVSLLNEPILSEDSLNDSSSDDSLSAGMPAAPVVVKVDDEANENKKNSASISRRYQQFQINQYKYVAPTSRPTIPLKDGARIKMSSIVTSRGGSIPVKSISGARNGREAFQGRVKEPQPLDLSDMPILQEFESRLRKIESELTHFDALSTSFGAECESRQSIHLSSIPADDSVSLNSSDFTNLLYREKRFVESSPLQKDDDNVNVLRFGVDRTGGASVASVTGSDLLRRSGLDNPSSTESDSLMYLYYQTVGDGQPGQDVAEADTTLEELKEMLKSNNDNSRMSTYVDREVAAAMRELQDSDSENESDSDLSLSMNSITENLVHRAGSLVNVARNLTASSYTPSIVSRVSTSAAHIIQTTAPGVDRSSRRIGAANGTAPADLTAYSLDALMGTVKKL